VADFTARICTVRIHDVGNGLPCVGNAEWDETRVVFSKTKDDRPFNDAASVDINRICPVNVPDKDGNSHKFQATIFYELPPQAAIFAGKVMPLLTKYLY